MVVGGILALFLLFAYGRAYYQNYQIQKEIDRLQAESERLEAKKLKTLDMLQYVQSPDFVENKARTELNLVKPGEHMIIIQGGTTSAARQNSEPMLESESNPVRWWHYFFGN